MGETGELQVSSRQAENSIEVIVKDSGEGISENIQNQIFDPFFTTKLTGEGSGLGLSIIKKVVEKHDGTIGFVSSEADGTTFTVRLPIQ